MTHLKPLALIALAACTAIPAISFAQDTPAQKTQAPVSNKAKRNGGPMGPIYSVWAKDLNLDEATQAKLAEISSKQQEANSLNYTKVPQLVKAIEADKAAGKTEDAKAKQAQLDQIKAEVSKSNASFRAQAMALLTPEQQKKLAVAVAFRASQFSKITLTPDQTKKVMDKLESSVDSYINDQKEIDSKKLGPILKALAQEVLTPEQKEQLSKPKDSAKPAAATEKKPQPAADKK
jgi:Spy/CpxP family protein refolding chaperone